MHEALEVAVVFSLSQVAPLGRAGAILVKVKGISLRTAMAVGPNRPPAKTQRLLRAKA